MMGKDRIVGFCEEANILMLAKFSSFSPRPVIIRDLHQVITRSAGKNQL
jgi:hypothetical protein